MTSINTHGSIKSSAPTRDDYVLLRVDGRLQLHHRNDAGGVCLMIDDVRRRLRQGRKLALAKACGVRSDLRVLDAMAGFGLDGITLAALGCSVVMVERDPLLYALLNDAVARARVELPLAASIECCAGDARDVICADTPFDTIYLDPMFPIRDKHALPRKSAQLLADLLGAPPDDLLELIASAKRSARVRVVVKRRRHDPVLAAPDWQIVGRSVRFDVYRGTAATEAD
jgi:16S rRNA (guanine1516-N2)-methyltransferase